MSQWVIRRCGLVTFFLLLCRSGLWAVDVQAPVTDDPVFVRFGQALIECAPVAAADDQKAFDAAAKRLQENPVLRDAMDESVLWGGHKVGAGFHPDENTTTEFDSTVFRRLYLSTYMFYGEPRISVHSRLLVLSVPCKFRNNLDMGQYPYPFWHSAAKWYSYQAARQVEFVFRRGKLLAAYRSGAEDPARPLVNRSFDGNWTWKNSSGQEQPSVTLFTHLFSEKNPHVPELDKAYRALAGELRGQNCMSCHVPNNPYKMDKLSLLNYPNQSLGSRHQLVNELNNNTMPPKTKEKPMGIPEAAERTRLLQLAKVFAELGDQAFEYEKTAGAPGKQEQP